jgi:hypothetical protein
VQRARSTLYLPHSNLLRSSYFELLIGDLIILSTSPRYHIIFNLYLPKMFGLLQIAILIAVCFTSVHGHGLITAATGANGVTGKGFAVVDGTPRNTGLPIKAIEVGLQYLFSCTMFLILRRRVTPASSVITRLRLARSAAVAVPNLVAILMLPLNSRVSRTSFSDHVLVE